MTLNEMLLRLHRRLGISTGAQDELLVVHKNVNGGDHRKDGKCHVDRMETPLLDPGFLRRAEKIDEAPG